MPDWLVALLIVWAWSWGFVIAWAIAHERKSFWHGFLDGLALKMFWPKHSR